MFERLVARLFVRLLSDVRPVLTVLKQDEAALGRSSTSALDRLWLVDRDASETRARRALRLGLIEDCGPGHVVVGSPHRMVRLTPLGRALS